MKYVPRIYDDIYAKHLHPDLNQTFSVTKDVQCVTINMEIDMVSLVNALPSKLCHSLLECNLS